MKLQGKLQGKSAVITGAGTGIGRACAELFAKEGAAVTLGGRRREPLEETAGAIAREGGRAKAVPCDVSKGGDVIRLVEAATEAFGGLHVLVNNAAHWMPGTLEQTSEEEWDRVMATNLKGVFLLCRAALPELRKQGGSIVNIGSVAGLVGMKNRAAYSASKGGLLLLTKCIALDHAAEGIRANCICPGLVRTPLAEYALSLADDPAAELRRREAETPLGRIGVPQDVAELALFLASDASSWMTGAAVPVDGGFTAA